MMVKSNFSEDDGGALGDVAAVTPTETIPPVETAETPPEIAPTEATPVEAVRPVPSPPKQTLSRSHFDGSLATADPARARRLSFGAFFTSRTILSKYVEEAETSDNRQAQRPTTESA